MKLKLSFQIIIVVQILYCLFQLPWLIIGLLFAIADGGSPSTDFFLFILTTLTVFIGSISSFRFSSHYFLKKKMGKFFKTALPIFQWTFMISGLAEQFFWDYATIPFLFFARGKNLTYIQWTFIQSICVLLPILSGVLLIIMQHQHRKYIQGVENQLKN